MNFKAFPTFAKFSSFALVVLSSNSLFVASISFFLVAIATSLVRFVCLDCSVNSSSAICASIFACVSAFALSIIACSLADSWVAYSSSIAFKASNFKTSSSICSALNLFSLYWIKCFSLSSFEFVSSICSLSNAKSFAFCSDLKPSI